MIKQFLLLVNMLVLMVFNSVFQSDVNVNMLVPTTVVAGDEITVTVKLYKSDFESFARFQQVIPPGLTATPVETANADFSFKDQKVRFIWLKIPAENQITISYKLKVDERLKGNFDLQGRFSYLANNERKNTDFPTKTITINPSPSIDQNLIVDISEFKELARPSQPTANIEEQVLCIRQTPVESNGEYIVNLLVHKGNKEKFAKIQETIPTGYKAESIDNKDGLFSFNDQVVKFLWMNLPSEAFFTVSYKLIPDEGAGELNALQGTFSYIVNDNTLNINILEQDLDIANITDENLATLLQSAAPVQIEEQSRPTTTYIPGEHSGKVRIEIAEKARKLLESGLKDYSLEPENGIYYRVQVAAGHKPINIERYFRKYNLDMEVRSEMHEGWRKYSVGSFEVYKAARDYRQHIWNTTTIDDAFVSAYNDGKRVTVQEALMITNHQWYR